MIAIQIEQITEFKNPDCLGSLLTRGWEIESLQNIQGCCSVDTKCCISEMGSRSRLTGLPPRHFEVTAFTKALEVHIKKTYLWNIDAS
ncbi:hypothetical protein TNCV_903961 [Trichonephila clavipes]|nr:hypothetical protein TNCV_903961 [Trichonephila clavipes]